MLRISQNLSLQQKMAPQLIQSLQLLQMSTLELELKIKQEMELTLVGLQNSGKTTLVNVVAVRRSRRARSGRART